MFKWIDKGFVLIAFCEQKFIHSLMFCDCFFFVKVIADLGPIPETLGVR